MRICENCKKVFQDDMNYCPYCGTKYHDYKDDLKQAMDDLFEETTDKKEEVVIQSRVQRQEMLKEEKTNRLLNRVLVVMIVMIIATMLVGAVMIAEKFLPSLPGIVEDTNPTNNDSSDNDTNIDDSNDDQTIVDDNQEDDEIIDDEVIVNDSNDGEVVDVTNVEDGDFYVDKIKVKKENDQIKVEVTCHALMAGNAYLKDDSNLDIGPINIKEGKNQFYFLVNGNTNYTLYFDASNGRDYEYSISKDVIDKAIKKH